MPTFGTPVYAGNSAVSTSLTLPVPGDLQEGDLLVVALRSQDGGSSNAWSVPEGFERVMADPVLPAATSRVGDILVKTAMASEPESYTFTGPSGRNVGIAVRMVPDSTDLVSRVGTSPYGGGASASGGTMTVPDRPINAAPALSLLAIGAEITAGVSHVPTVTGGFSQIGLAQSSMDTSTSGSRTAIWLGWRAEPDTTADTFTAGYTSTSSLGVFHAVFTGGTTPPVDPPDPEVIPPGFRSVAQMLSTPGATWAHRGGSASWPEHTEMAYRNSALAGYGALEFSCSRTIDGVWFGLHDASINATSETTGLPNASEMTWAEVQEYQVTLNSGGNPQPYWKMTDFLDTYAQTHVCIMDYKEAWQHKDEWYSILDSYGARQRIIIKQWGPTTDGPDIKARAGAMGFSTWGFFGDADALDGTMGASEQYFTILGMEWNASPEAWAIALGFGKPVVGHITNSKGAYDTAILNGAHMAQCSNTVSIPAVGAPTTLQSWDAVYVGGSRIPAYSIYLGASKL